MKKDEVLGPMNRRKALLLGGKAVGAIALGGMLFSCNDPTTQLPTDPADPSDPGNTGGSTDTGGGNSGGSTGGSSAWLVGGTGLITAAYPADSIFDGAGTCAVTVSKQTTLGPCYFADTTGEDISEGLQGLPMQLCLRLVDSNCDPLEGYTIEVWHCDASGLYSGDTSNSSDSSSFAGSFCTGGDSAAAKSTWYRGMLKTNNSGRVNFKSCFPGWYRGRTVHIHFAVVDSNGNRKLISQLCFDDGFVSEIFTEHSSYSSRGDQDTPLSGGRDTVFPSSGYENFMLTTEQNSDGSLLAYHTIQLN